MNEELIGLNVSVESLKRYRSVLRQNTSRSKLLDGQLLAIVSTALLRPMQLKVQTGPISIELEWYENLCRQRQLLLWLMENDEEEEGKKEEKLATQVDSSHLALDIIRSLQEEFVTIHKAETLVSNILQTFLQLDRQKENQATLLECLNFSTLVLDSDCSTNILNLACEAAFTLGLHVSALEAMRIIPFLMRVKEFPQNLLRCLNSMEERKYNEKSKTTSTSKEEEYEDLVMKENPLAYFPLQSFSVPENQGSVMTRLQIIGNVLFLDTSVNKGKRKSGLFSPSSFIVIPFEPEFNPEGSFTVELWASLSISCPGGTLLSSFTNDELYPRGYKVACRVQDNAIEWTFRCGVHCCVGKVFLEDDTPHENKKQYRKGMESEIWTHFVGVFDSELKTISVYLDGKLAESITVVEAPTRNSDAPIFLGGGERSQFYGNIHDFVIYGNCQQPSSILRRYQKVTSSKAEEGEEEEGEEEEINHPLTNLIVRIIRVLPVTSIMQNSEASLHSYSQILQGLVARIDEGGKQALLLLLRAADQYKVTLTSEIQTILIKLTATSDYDISDEAARILASCRQSSSPVDSLRALAAFLLKRSKEQRLASDSLVRALLSLQNQNRFIGNEFIEFYVEPMLNCLRLLPQDVQLQQLVHSALCVVSARGWQASQRSAQVCYELLEVYSPNDSTSIDFSSGSLFDLKWTLFDHICRLVFISTKEDSEVKDFIKETSWAIENSSSNLYDESYFERVQKMIALPLVHVARFKNKPWEKEMRDAMCNVFTSLLSRLSQGTMEVTPTGLALRCYKSSWRTLSHLSKMHQDGLEYTDASQRIVSACKILGTTISSQDQYFSQESVEITEDEDDFQRRYIDLIFRIAEKEERKLALKNQSFGFSLLSKTLRLSCLNSHQKNRCLKLLISNDLPLLETGSSEKERSELAIALEEFLKECFFEGDEELCIEASNRFLFVAPSEAFELCHSKYKEKLREADSHRSLNSFRFSNDALDLMRVLPETSSAFPQFGTSNSFVNQRSEVFIMKGIQGMISGKFYFEIASEHKNEIVLAQIGVCTSKQKTDFACGCQVLVGNGHGVGVMIDIDGGVLSVFSILEDDVLCGRAQRPIKLGPVKSQVTLPAKRPLFPLFALLTSGKRVLVSAIENASLQVQTEENGDTKDVTENKFVGPFAGLFDSSRSELFSCGQNAFGELGISSDDRKSRKRLTESYSTKSLVVCSVAAGNEFSAAIDSQGLVYTWGMNVKGSCGQGLLGSMEHPPSLIPVPTLVPSLQRKVVSRICAQNGCENMFAITSDGLETFAWGLNKFGQCGLGHLEEAVFSPAIVNGLKHRVIDVANGYSHSLFLTENGTIFSCGLNSKGQLGLGTSGDIRPTPQEIRSSVKFSSVSVGALHSAAISQDGKVWTFGKNDFGQLGLGENGPQHVETPQCIFSLGGKFAEKVACGYHFTLVSTSDSVLFSFGKNDSGQLGLGHARESCIPQVVLQPYDGRIAALSCGTGHWVAVTIDGRAFSCGRNKTGAVGDGTSSDRLVPFELDFSGRGTCVQVAAGFHHTLVLCAQVDECFFDQNKGNIYSQFISNCTRTSSIPSPAILATSKWLQEELLSFPINPFVLKLACESNNTFRDLEISRCFEVVSEAVKATDYELGVLALAWILKILVGRQVFLEEDSLKILLKIAGKRTNTHDLSLASEAVHVLRNLHKANLLDESQLVVFMRDDTYKLGAVALFGGEVEVIRVQGRARLVAGDVDRGHSGLISWYNPDSRIIAQIVLDDGETMFVRKASDLIPESKSSIPIPGSHAFEILDIILELSRSDAFACKALGSILKAQPSLVARLKEHQSFFVHLTSRKSNWGKSITWLERRYLRLINLNKPQQVPFDAIEDSLEILSSDYSQKKMVEVAKIDLRPGTEMIVDPVDLETGNHFEEKSNNHKEGISCFMFEQSLDLFPSIALNDEWSVTIDVAWLEFSPITSSLLNDFCTLDPAGFIAIGDEVSAEALASHCFYRLSFVKGPKQIKVFKNGSKILTFTTTGLGPRLLFGNGSCRFLVSAGQYRDYAMSDDEVRFLGLPSAQGISEPTEFALANHLRDDLQLPLIWCLKFLQKCGSLKEAKTRLSMAEPALIRRARAKARILSTLGFDTSSCALAVASTTSIIESIAFLLDSRQNVFDKSSAKAFGKISFTNTSSYQNKVSIGMQSMKYSDKLVKAREGAGLDSTNETFQLSNNTKSSILQQTGRDLPVYSDLNSVTKELFASYARQATVYILDADARNALLGNSKHVFMREYLRAFPLKDVENPEIASVTDELFDQPNNAVQVLRKKLLAFGGHEASDCVQQTALIESSIDTSRDNWIQYSPFLTSGKTHDKVWFVSNEKVIQGELNRDFVGFEEEVEIEIGSIRLLKPPSMLKVSPPPRIVQLQYLSSERKRAKEEKETYLWKNSVCKSLLEILLSELAELASWSSHRTLESGLQIAPANAFRLVVKNSEFEIWRPVSVVPGFYSLGDIAEPSTSETPIICYMVSDEETLGRGGESSVSLLSPPSAFELVWKENDVRFWRPIPPPEYTALGIVITLDEFPPSPNEVRCVHYSCVRPSRITSGVWSKEDVVQVWKVDNQANSFLLRVPGGNDIDFDNIIGEEDVDILEIQEEGEEILNFKEVIKTKASTSLLPLSLSVNSAKSSADIAFWILFLLVEIGSLEDFPWKSRIFCPPLIHALLRLANESIEGVKALRALGAIVANINPSTVLSNSSLRAEFDGLKRKSEMLLAHECAESRDPDFTLYSSGLCAIVELLIPLNFVEGDDGMPSTVSELNAIMDAFQSPDTSRFPDDFLMSEDTFLKLARADDTSVIETSTHPYSSEEQVNGTLKVGNATSLICRFDRRSATSFGDGLLLEVDDSTEVLQGNFGGSVVRIPSSSFHYRFPVEQTLNWSLSPTLKGSNIRLSNGQMTASMRKDKVWETVLGSKGFSKGINSWECKVDRCTASSNIFFGIAAKDCNVESYVGCDDLGWGWIGCLACWHSGRKVKHPFGQRLKTGDIIRVTLDLHRRCFSIAINGKDQGIALDRIPNPTLLEEGKLFPAFAFYNKYDQITLLRGGVAT